MRDNWASRLSSSRRLRAISSCFSSCCLKRSRARVGTFTYTKTMQRAWNGEREEKNEYDPHQLQKADLEQLSWNFRLPSPTLLLPSSQLHLQAAMTEESQIKMPSRAILWPSLAWSLRLLSDLGSALTWQARSSCAVCAATALAAVISLSSSASPTTTWLAASQRLLVAVATSLA